jgi:hypothetical protein
MTKFRRGPGPLVTVMLPTRGRLQWLLESIDSLNSLAVDKGLIEYILKVDSDDKETVGLAERLSGVLPLSVVVSPRGLGYLDMPHWVWDMTRYARGDWLFLFNDDARMLTQGWDQVLLSLPREVSWHGVDDVCLLSAQTQGKPLQTEFVFVRRKAIEVLGRWGASPHLDSWQWYVHNCVGSAHWCPVLIAHAHDGAKDATRGDLLRAMDGVPYNTYGLIHQRLLDAHKLLAYIHKEMP